MSGEAIIREAIIHILNSSILIFLLIVGVVYVFVTIENYVLENFVIENFVIEKYVTNGEEPDWDDEKWKTYEKVNNCYAYAFDNLKKRDAKPQPDNQNPDTYNCSDLEKWIKRDLVDSNGKKFELHKGYFDEPCPPNTHKIYMVHSGDDYHFYRLDSDNRWSHKPGSTPVSRVDADDKEIIDPSRANHHYENHNYNTSCGFYCVPKIKERF